MKAFALAAVIAAAGISSPIFAQPAFPPQLVSQLPVGQAAPAGFTKLRVSLASGDDAPESQVHLGNLTVCTETACYQSPMPPLVTLTNTRAGDSTVVATLTVPYGRFRSVTLEPVSGLKTAGGEWILKSPLEIPEGFYGGEIFLVLGKNVYPDSTNFSPKAAASGLYRDEFTSVYYDPEFPLDKRLDHGAILSFPAGATSEPHIMSVDVHDIDEPFPEVDIYPVFSLSKPGSLQVSQIIRRPRADAGSLTARPEALPPPGTSVPRRVLPLPPTHTFMLQKTGSLPAYSGLSSPSAQNDQQDATPVGSVATSAAGWTDCAAALNNPANQDAITNSLRSVGATYLDWCTTIPPYIHIGIATLSDARQSLSIRYSKEANVNGKLQLPLTTIDQWVTPSSHFMINGFTWVGDYGFTGGDGLAKGYLTANGYVLGDNRTTGGSAGKFPGFPPGTADLPKWVIYQNSGAGRNYFSQQSQSVGSYNYFAISSSTSIARNGVCTTDATSDRWSAVGVASYMPPRVIFVSSTSTSQTTAAALCPVMEALGAFNAIRLDGGPSAVFLRDGTLVNELKGLYAAEYGRMRHIPYALRLGW